MPPCVNLYITLAVSKKTRQTRLRIFRANKNVLCYNDIRADVIYSANKT